MLTGNSGVATQLWSLQWEVFFSLLLPLYVFVVLAVRARWVVLISLGLIVLGTYTGSSALEYLPMFGIGVALAKVWPSMLEAGARIVSWRAGWLVWIGGTLVSLLLMVSFWLVGPHPTVWFLAISRALIVVGAAGLLVIAGLSPGARRFFDWAPLATLGRLSFSLYLVHEPIVMVFAELLPHHARLGAAIAIVASLLFAVVFHRAVERPSQVLARRLGHAGPVVPTTHPEDLATATPATRAAHRSDRAR